MSDVWEQRFFGDAEAQPGTDSDGDGQSNLDESMAGTDPLDAMNQLAAKMQPTVQGEPELSWSAVVGKDYRVEESTDFIQWTDALGALTILDGVASFRPAGYLATSSFPLAVSVPAATSVPATSPAGLVKSLGNHNLFPAYATLSFGEFPFVWVEQLGEARSVLHLSTLAGEQVVVASGEDWRWCGTLIDCFHAGRRHTVSLMVFDLTGVGIPAPVELPTGHRWKLVTSGLSATAGADVSLLMGDLHSWSHGANARQSLVVGSLSQATAVTVSSLDEEPETPGDAVVPMARFWRVVPQDRDTDLDGLDDAEECLVGSNPNLPDSDGDGLTDGAEVGVHNSNPMSGDTDGDGVSDGEEVASGTNPANGDTDGDGDSDGEEKTNHTDPKNEDSNNEYQLFAEVGISDRDLLDDLWSVSMSVDQSSWQFVTTNYVTGDQSDARSVGWGKIPVHRGELMTFHLNWVNAFYPNSDEYRIEFKWSPDYPIQPIAYPDNSPLDDSLPRGGEGGWDLPDTSEVRWVYYYPKPSLRAWSPGTLGNPGREVKRLVKEKLHFVLLIPNLDNDDERPEGSKDSDDSVLGPNDDDLVQVEMDVLPHGVKYGEIRVELPANVHAYTASGERLVPSDLVVNLSNPSGKLADLATRSVKIYLEATSAEPNCFLVLSHGGISASLQLVFASLRTDLNRDGRIDNEDLTYRNGEPGSPFRFWINDDNDGDSEGAVEVLNSNTKDYETAGFLNTDAIKNIRDLEDFARLHLNIGGLHDAFNNGDLQLGLKWTNVTGTPKINLYKAYETDGGDQYLRNPAIAAEQIQNEYDNPIESVGAKTTIAPSATFVFEQEVFANLSQAQPTTHFIFEGAGAGKGLLKIVILKDGVEIGEGPGLWFDLVNIKSMYERAVVTASFSEPWNYAQAGDLPAFSVSVAADPQGHVFKQPLGETKESLVFVHGWKMDAEDVRSFGETMFKRLWWEGYKGRFRVFRWPTYTGDYSFSDSEFMAWKCGSSLKNYIEGSTPGASLPSDYRKCVAAHSLGNVVVGSALKQGLVPDRYFVMQGAIASGCYDTSDAVNGFANPSAASSAFNAVPAIAALRTMFSGGEGGKSTPDHDSPDWGYRGCLVGASAGKVVNFCNPRDFALTTGSTIGVDTNWLAWQFGYKPRDRTISGDVNFEYCYTPTATEGQRLKLYRYTDSTHGTVSAERLLADAHESRGFLARTRSLPIGADIEAGGIVDTTVNLQATYGFTDSRGDHSGQFGRTIHSVRPFYQRIVQELE